MDMTMSSATPIRIEVVTTPQSNGMAESLVKTLKRNYANLADPTRKL